MKAAVLHGNNNIQYEEVDKPYVGPNMVLVKVKAVGICGSDIPRVFSGGAHFYPIILGHEFSGEIVAIGAEVKNLKIKDHVAGVPLIPCMKCEDCLNGNYAFCKNYNFIGSRVNGAFAEYVSLPAENAILIDKTIPFSTAAFFEPATVALHGLFCNQYEPGKKVAILGSGTIGLFVLQWAKKIGAESITVMDISPSKLETAKKYGADYTINTISDDTQRITNEITGSRGFDFLFETAGNNITMQMSFDLAGNKSRICFIGTSPKEVCFSSKLFEKMNRKEFLLTGSWMSYSSPFPGVEWKMTADSFADGTIYINNDMIHKKYHLSDVYSAFEEFKNPQNISGKILIVND